MKYAGSEHLEARGVPMSELGREVADILGQVFAGLYHVNGIETGNWGDNYCVEVNIGRELATYDGVHLTALVVLCHDRMIRVSVQPCNMQYIKLQFHKRTRRYGGNMWERHPTIESAVDAIRGIIGLGVAGDVS